MPIHGEMPRYGRRFCLGAISLALLAACGSGGPTPSASVPIHLRNFHIAIAKQVHPGFTRLAIWSAGPTMHELNIARTDFPAKDLPLSDDGTVDDLDPHAGFTHLAEAEGIDIGQRAHLDVHLTPGHYVLYCNMPGHYQAGMYTDFEVTA